MPLVLKFIAIDFFVSYMLLKSSTTDFATSAKLIFFIFSEEIAASSLKSRGTMVMGGLLIIDRECADKCGNPFVRLLAIDTAPKLVGNINASSSTDMSRDFAKRAVTNSGYMGKPAKLPLLHVAAVNAVLISDCKKIIIEHGENEITKSPTIVERQQGETLASFLQAVIEVLGSLPVTLYPNYVSAVSQIPTADGLVVLGCEYDTQRAREIRSNLPDSTELKREEKKKLCVVNLRTHKADTEVIEFDNVGEVMVMDKLFVADEVSSYMQR